MHVISIKKLREFWGRFPDSEEALKTWYAEAKAASWGNPTDIKAKYCSASILKGNRVVFNICGNKYRLVVRVLYPYFTVHIRFVGTHKEYDAIDAEVV
jgi:mRNA interferase HigB